MENGREREEIENELTLQDFQPFVSPPRFRDLSLPDSSPQGDIYIYTRTWGIKWKQRERRKGAVTFGRRGRESLFPFIA